MQTNAENACSEVKNYSKMLFDYAEKINDCTVNLKTWKKEILKTIDTTYYNTQNNKTTCVDIFNDQGKLVYLKNTVSGALERLIVMVKQVNASIRLSDKARAKITEANQSMDSMATTMLTSLKQNGTALCDMLQRHEAVWSKLNKTNESLEVTSQRAGNVSASADKTKSAITASGKLVDGASKAVKALSQPGGLFAPNVLGISNNVTVAMENMKNANDALNRGVQLSGEVSSVVAKAKGEMDDEYKVLNDVLKILQERLKDINITTSSVSASECSSKLSELLDGTHTEALRFANRLNVGELLKADETLRGLEAQAEKISINVTSINGKLEVAARNLKEATELDRSAAAAAEAAVAEALKHLMGRTCTIANKLRVLQNNLTLLNTDARSMKKSVSEEEAQAIAALKDADGSSDMSPHVEEGFAPAVRMTALLDRELERSSAQIEKVTASHAAWKLKEVRSDNANVFDAVRDAVVGIFAGTHEKPSEDVCTASATAELVKKLRTGTDGQSLLRNTSAVTELSHFAAKMNAELASAARRVSTATVRAAEANKALAEAVRRAHEEAAGRRCPPLYRQLLNALSGRW
ncbi:hypothetical protein, conserved in T. vivax [Trypanosoma vivax Y486]|uniref:Uncharacterized protein n=1 Tax=Trypanosoma vivax (strain Y486) TaxID=1055687 RepID=F9WPU5_TRYVY|nr:hypothetical protein, conserved in T. vivax [Trypanosoma vivax Y486]|eukprot:CCD19572.1 hypothetical protein, conserved in T. vivax [Trypanosoma vivax Y486]